MNFPTAASLANEKIRAVPTGISSFDRVTGIGGIPLGKITVVSGQPSVGKSTLALSLVREAQQEGLRCLFYDVEYSYDDTYAESIGVDPKNVWILRERYAEDGLDRLEAALDAGEFDVAIIDSVGALLSRVEAEKDAGGKTIGSQASLVARFVRKIVPVLSLRKIALVCLTHEFTDIMSGKVMASGGAKMMYHASLHLRLKQKYGVILKQGENKIGKVIVAEVKKNKCAATEGKEADAHFIYGEAFSVAASLLDDAIEAGIFTKNGNTYYLNGEKLGVISKVREWLKDEEHQEQIKTALGAS